MRRQIHRAGSRPSGRYVRDLPSPRAGNVCPEPSDTEGPRAALREAINRTVTKDLREHGAEAILEAQASGAVVDNEPLVSDIELAVIMADWERRGAQAIHDLARDRPEKFLALGVAIALGEV